MTRSSRPRVGAIIAGCLLALASAAQAAATPPTPASGQTWQTSELEYRWLSGSEPPGWIRPAIHAAAQDATESTQASTPDFSHADGGPGWIAYTGDIPTNYAVGYAVRNVPSSFGIRLRPHGYKLDWGTLRWCQFYQSPPNGCYDAELITLHEFGHVLTLGHIDETTVSDWTDTVMHVAPKTKAKVGWNAHDFGRCDVARLQIRYETRTPATPISTCLDLPTDLSLSVSPGSYGATVSFNATLEIDPGAAYPELAGDPLAGRNVWLQRRPIGGSIWTDLAQLTSQPSSPGRYTRALAVYGTYDYRARFSATAGEGLDGAFSGVVRISMTDPCVSSRGAGSINAPTC